jgi:hypothetical protein
MSELVARFFLGYSKRLSGLRQIPGVGDLAHRVSRHILPTDRRIWIQVRNGLGEGL